MGNAIVIIVLIIIFALAGYKIYLNKKNNVKCSGCPSCSMNKSCASSKIDK